MITSKLTIISWEQDVTVMVDISISTLTHNFSRDQERKVLGISRKRIQDKSRSILVLLCKFLYMQDTCMCAVLVSPSLKKTKQNNSRIEEGSGKDNRNDRMYRVASKQG